MRNLTRRNVTAFDSWEKWLDASHSLSFQEMREYLGENAGVLSYSEAFPARVNLRETLRRYPWRAVVFLYRSSDRYGHYVACWERKNTLYVFDSYGAEPDSWGRYLTGSMRRRLGQDMPLLLLAIDRAGYEGVEWNEYPFQKMSPEIATCGRWCILRLWKRSLGVEAFKKWVDDQCNRLQIPPDILVTYLTFKN